MTERIHNFNPGPGALPLSVLEEIQAELIDYRGTGMSILEISHRSPAFDEVLDQAVSRVKRMLGLNDNHQVLFMHGGASTQFYMVPKNFLSAGAVADYINTGTWSTKAMAEAKVLGHRIHTAASSEDRDFCYIPKEFNFSPEAVYVHLTSNNTIKGTQWRNFPDTFGVPLISDMSSDILSRPIDVDKFGLIYAGAQKNLGPAGVALAIIRKDMLDRVQIGLPNMMSYQVQASKGSRYNTPPVFSIYVVNLVLGWLENEIGGVEAMAAVNAEKAALLYNYIDQDDFYSGTAEKDSRSLMNVTFRLPTVDLEKEFVSKALGQGLGGLKGHRSVGGCRASIYNAVTLEAVCELVDFMKEFSRVMG